VPWDHYHVSGVPDDKIGQDSHSSRSSNAGITVQVYARKWKNWVTSKDVMSLTNAHENQLHDVIKRQYLHC